MKRKHDTINYTHDEEFDDQTLLVTTRLWTTVAKDFVQFNYCTPVIVDMRREMTDEERGPFGVVSLGGRASLHVLLVCLYRVHETCRARENRARTKVSPSSTASLPQTGSMTVCMHARYRSYAQHRILGRSRQFFWSCDVDFSMAACKSMRHLFVFGL